MAAARHDAPPPDVAVGPCRQRAGRADDLARTSATWGIVIPYCTQVRMRAWWDHGISRVVRGSGSTGAATSSLRTGAGDETDSTRGFRAGCSADGAGSETDGGSPFRREERLGCAARARDPLTVITVRGLLLLPVIGQGSSRLFGCSRYRSGIRQLWQVVTADAGCHVNIKINKSP
jgi:hypothetical protein